MPYYYTITTLAMLAIHGWPLTGAEPGWAGTTACPPITDQQTNFIIIHYHTVSIAPLYTVLGNY